MKRYYTVKEVSKALEVSTNTVYKYLKEGKIKGKRIGKGRFKIPRGELFPYIHHASQKRSKETYSNKDLLADFTHEFSTDASDFKGVAPGKIDFVFFRLFEAMTFIGLGVIFLFLKSDIFTISGGRIAQSIGNTAFNLLSILLLISGLLILLECFYIRKLKQFQTHVFVLLLAVLSFWGYATLTTGGYGRFVFILAFMAIIVSHLIKGVASYDLSSTFFDEFVKFSFLLALFGGIIVLLSPSTFVFAPVANLAKSYPVVFALLWFGWFFSGFIYLLSPYGKQTKFYVPFISLSSLFALIIAVQHTFQADWDVAYLSYLTSGFGFFLVWWHDSNFKIAVKRTHLFFLPFFWVGITLILGIFVIRVAQQQVKSKAIEQTTSHLNKIVNEVNFFFEENSAAITYASRNRSLLSSISLGDENKAIFDAKKIYDGLNGVRRVIVYTEDATAIGVYPRSAIGQGTNFSSREYYRRTKDSLRGYITPLFMSVTNEPAVLQTEPLFINGRFGGFVGVAMDLDEVSLGYQSELGQNRQIHALDENGVLVLDTNIDLIGENADPELFDSHGDVYETADFVRIRQHAKLPRWDVFLDIDKEAIYKNVSAVNVAFSVFLVLNSIFSIGAATALVKKKQ